MAWWKKNNKTAQTRPELCDLCAATFTEGEAVRGYVPDWRAHLPERHRIRARSPTAATSWPTSRPQGPARSGNSRPPVPPRRRHAWATTAALVELWRTGHAITAAPPLGPRPDDPGDAAA
ncbi:hypothetical protein AQJ11_13080 [Streptomyces corchorusii]|uniref:Uncharacterized protein n=2 Tax=Streptomyces TaxID=1883 RepID=A0A101QEQ0_STRCK|nr:hypothetical protein [Streptomyces corchorusii]KUN28445.1 hypothetical protein AQJ11_13080 [Streptomyces corchorusii]